MLLNTEIPAEELGDSSGCRGEGRCAGDVAAAAADSPDCYSMLR